jgi:FAD synthase
MIHDIREAIKTAGIATVARGAGVRYSTLRRVVNGLASGRKIAVPVADYLQLLGIPCGPLDVSEGQRIVTVKRFHRVAICRLEPGIRYSGTCQISDSGNIDFHRISAPTIAGIEKRMKEILNVH